MYLSTRPLVHLLCRQVGASCALKRLALSGGDRNAPNRSKEAGRSDEGAVGSYETSYKAIHAVRSRASRLVGAQEAPQAEIRLSSFYFPPRHVPLRLRRSQRRSRFFSQGLLDCSSGCPQVRSPLGCTSSSRARSLPTSRSRQMSSFADALCSAVQIASLAVFVPTIL